MCLSLILILCCNCSCKSHVYIGSLWPEIERPQTRKTTVSFSMNDLDPLGEEKKKEVMDEIVALVTYIKALEAGLKAYDAEMVRHNNKFKQTVVKSKSD